MLDNKATPVSMARLLPENKSEQTVQTNKSQERLLTISWIFQRSTDLHLFFKQNSEAG
jgi:hypothetical protein